MPTMSPAEISATRHLIGLTRVEFADACGVTAQAIKLWETGKSDPYESRVALARLLDREPDAMLEWV